MDSARGVQTSLWTGCPIGILRAPRSYAAPPERFAGLRVLHRPSAPRHPPRTLSCLCVPSLDPLQKKGQAWLREVSLFHSPVVIRLVRTGSTEPTRLHLRSSASLFLPSAKLK